MKKGASHIDWAIGMGIFVIYVLSLFIFFQPNTQEEFDNERLISIIELGLNDNAYTKVEVNPLFINSTNVDNGRYEIQVAGVFPLDGDNDDITIKNITGDFLTFSIVGPSGSKVFSFDGRVDNNVLNKFFLYHSPGANYNRVSPSEPTKINSVDNFTHEFGVTETLKGIREENLTALFANDYDTLKTIFSYPSSKDFSILIYKSKTLRYTDTDLIYSFQEVTPPNQESVSAKEFKDWLLNVNGSREDIIINLRVW